jgi:hypothetical protein
MQALGDKLSPHKTRGDTLQQSITKIEAEWSLDSSDCQELSRSGVRGLNQLANLPPPPPRQRCSCRNYFLTPLFRCGSAHTTLTPNHHSLTLFQKYQISQRLRHLAPHRYFKLIWSNLKGLFFSTAPHPAHFLWQLGQACAVFSPLTQCQNMPRLPSSHHLTYSLCSPPPSPSLSCPLLPLPSPLHTHTHTHTHTSTHVYTYMHTHMHTSF